MVSISASIMMNAFTCQAAAVQSTHSWCTSMVQRSLKLAMRPLAEATRCFMVSLLIVKYCASHLQLLLQLTG